MQVNPSPASGTTSPYTGPCPDLDAALATREVSFDQVCEAYFGQFDASDQVFEDEYKRLYPDLQRTFGAVHGLARNIYFTKPSAGLRGAAAETGDSHFHLIYDVGLAPSNTVFLLSRLDRLKTSSEAVLSGQSKAQFTELAYNAATNIFTIMEGQSLAALSGQHQEGRDLDNRVKVVDAALDDIATFSESASQTIARLDYSKGMLIGLALLTCLTLILNWAVPTLGWLPDSSSHFIFYTVLTGGVGAVVSVISRASSLKLDYEVGHLQLTLFGMFRPLVGGIFGFIICALIRSKVLNFATPPDPSESLFYYAGAAFIAGFSERLARGVLESAGRQITVTTIRPPRAPS